MHDRVWILHLLHALVLLLTHVIVLCVVTQQHRSEHAIAISISQLLFREFRLHGVAIVPITTVHHHVLLIRPGRREGPAYLVLSHCVLLGFGHFCDDRRFLIQEIAKPWIVLQFVQALI